MTIENDYRQILRSKLAERSRHRPRYSLRAFARDLGLTSARLSEVLSGKKGLSRQAAAMIASRLGLSVGEAQFFCDLVESRHARSLVARRKAQERVSSVSNRLNVGRVIEADQFQLIADWRHFAVRECLGLKDARSDAVSVGRKLGISSLLVKDAIARLVRLGLVEQRKGRLMPTQETVVSSDGVPSDAIKAFHEQILKKSIDALHVQGLDDRDFVSLLLSVRSVDLPMIKNRIRRFLRDLDREFSGSPEADRVISLGTHLTTLSQPEESR